MKQAGTVARSAATFSPIRQNSVQIRGIACLSRNGDELDFVAEQAVIDDSHHHQP